MSMSFETGYDALEQLIADESGERASDDLRNEAQTRFDVIDRVVKEVLGWPLDRIHVETHNDSGYTDYELRDHGTLAILEAKREGRSFELPVELAAGTCLIRPLVSDPKNGHLKKAMLQAMQYASMRGAATCIISNGHQWVVFLGSRSDGIPPLEGKAMVFPSLTAIRDRFVIFHNCLSERGLINRQIFSELSLGVTAPPAPLSASLSRYPGTKFRNTVQSNLQILGQVLLEDMPQEERYSELFLTQCYATSGALSAYAEVSKELLKSRNTEFLASLGASEVPATLRRGLNPELSAESLAAAASHRPIVLLGGVGVGKSTFIKHLVAVDAKTVFENAITILVDYGHGATFANPAEFAIDQIYRALLDDYEINVDDASFVEDLYRKELLLFDRGIFGGLKSQAPTEYLLRRVGHLDTLVSDRSAHLQRSVSRISRSHHRQVVVFLDNVDQRDHADQNRVFLVANEIAATWDATVFVTLRPETYYESLRYGAVSGYHPRVFSISPPRTDVMLKKRVQFALEVLSSRTDTRTTAGVGFQSESLELFLRVLNDNFAHNGPLLALIDNLAGGNMRRALDFVTQFIGSGHVDTAKIIGVETRDPGSYRIPLHEFLRSLLHGDGEYYDPQVSPIANLFTLDRQHPACHFLIPITLQYVRSRGDAADSSGYIDLDDVYQHMQGQGFTQDAVTFALAQMARHRLVEAPLDDFDPATSDRARITTVGAYTLANLPRLFTYCDAVVVDTPILDPEFRSHIVDARQLAERVTRVDVFRKYLDASWARAGLPEAGWAWPDVSAALDADIRTVCHGAALNYGELCSYGHA
ncbi:hypothetical protein [Miniimonas sp. S16]|uniref:hypothetical protein n=1 Tax=Miniimonas sp. S16 TaxID=2171623 RepID=UPI00131EEE6F|nr:hypothetical protein [Miniimonas sp. S16]